MGVVTLVLGAKFESSSSAGVNGDQTSNDAPGAGAAYAFVRDGDTWAQEAYLKASNADAVERFGRGIGIVGSTVVVSADLKDSGATGVDGDQNSNSRDASGAAYVFRIPTSSRAERRAPISPTR